MSNPALQKLRLLHSKAGLGHTCSVGATGRNGRVARKRPFAKGESTGSQRKVSYLQHRGRSERRLGTAIRLREPRGKS